MLFSIGERLADCYYHTYHTFVPNCHSEIIFSYSLNELKYIKEIIKMLQPFREVTDELQRDSETVGSIIPAFLDLRYKMEELSRPSGCISHHREIAAILLKSFENMFMTMVSFYLVIF